MIPRTMYISCERFVKAVLDFRSCNCRATTLALTLVVPLSFAVGCQKEVGGPGSMTLPSRYRIPDPALAKPIPQLEENWCWAASAEMVLSWRKHRISQCDQANLWPHDGTRDCCPEDPNPNCNHGRMPVRSFGPGKTDFKRIDFRVLEPSVIEQEIASNRPVIFSWRDCATNCGPDPTGHMMVLVGYEMKGKDVGFDILDPYPVHEGGYLKLLTYHQYVAYDSGKSHWADFYGFRDGDGHEYH
jgi:hypothetical protein